MRSRTQKLCGHESRWISTFHSFGARLLRRHLGRIEPYNSSFSIYDPEDCKALIKSLLKERGIDKTLASPETVYADISRAKNLCVGDQQEETGGVGYYNNILYEISQRYSEEMRGRNAVDFDDLLVLTVRVLEQNEDLLARYQEQFEHVLVDEYQDTNAAQYKLTRMLGAPQNNVCITGDPDQSIYKWRGADLGNILRFEEDYPTARTIMLEQNYRSTQKILDTANNLIRHNVERKEKNLWTENNPGEPVRVFRFRDEKEEAQAVVGLIRQLTLDGEEFGDIAIFYRTNSLSRALEQELMLTNIPYSIVGSVEFYLRKEVKDVLAYLQVVVNPRDVESVRRIINTPTRGIGEVTLQKLVARASQSGVSVLDVVCSDDLSFLGKRAASCVQGFAQLYKRLVELPNEDVTGSIQSVIDWTEYRLYLQKQFPGDHEDRFANLGELVNAAQDFERNVPDAGLLGFLEQVRLFSSVDRWEDDTSRVTLMTLHSAKGLEFPHVAIIGMEDGLLPLLRQSVDEEPDIEEERRLAYVGVTRARERLQLSHVDWRLRFGNEQRAYPSRFLSELAEGDGADHIVFDAATRDAMATPQKRLFSDDDWSTQQRSNKTSWDDMDVDSYDADYDYDDTSSDDEDPYPIGALVYHDDYGEGTITRVSRVGRRVCVTIDFGDLGTKQVFPAFCTLRRVR